MYAFPASSQPALPAKTDTIIVHHLSDPHRGRTSGARHPLDLYVQRHRRLPAEKKPNLIVITGDLTVSGTRDELREVAQALQSLAQDYDDLNPRQRVLVVPGPHDLDWANATANFDEFRAEFQPFIVPSFFGRDGSMLPGPQPFSHSTTEHYVVYLLNSCHTPVSLARQPAKALEELGKRYRDLWRERAKSLQRPNAPFDATLRARFLEQTTEMITRDTGVITPEERAHFEQIAQSLNLDDFNPAASNPGAEPANPLRILISHHPLIPYSGRDGRVFSAATGASELLQTARRLGFTLALHGHTHEPHVLTDLPLNDTTDQSLTQVGAGSLSGLTHDSPIVNEIIATRQRGADRWSLELTTLNVEADADRVAPRFFISGPAADTAAHRATPAAPDDASHAHGKLEDRLRVALRQFVDAIEDDSLDAPARPLATIKDIIKEVIFAGVETRIGLALKQRPLANGPIILKNEYIIPDTQLDEQYLHPFPYPDTVAAWSLVAGEILIFPRDFQDDTRLVNYDWLMRAAKFETVLRLLQDRAASGLDYNQRAATLAARLQARTLRLVDIFQPSPQAQTPTRFASFISVPIPLRVATASPTRPREIGALDVAVVDPDPARPAAVFTEERVDMLRTVAMVMDMILTTAHKLRKPRGVWDKQP